MIRRYVLRVLSVIMALAVVLAGVSSPPPAEALDVYTTPGIHHVNGRTWRTECSAYSSTVTRCRTDIIATTIVATGGRFVSTTDWTFNNLTYLPSPRSHWVGNPLATPGTHSLDGRLWKTECDTPLTGRNGCRSWIQAQVVDVVSRSPLRYGWKTLWLFNNMVRFQGTSPTPTPPGPITPSWPCTGAALPAGYNVGKDGMPSPPADAQHPANSYDPHYIGNYIRQVLKDERTTLSQKKCLGTVAGDHLLAHSRTRVIDGATSRWYPFAYNFSANPSVPALRAPWYSGLAQANVLTLTVLMEDLTGDTRWRQYGKETFESFLVPTSNGGFMSREKGFLWFEHYPTTPATSVLNGNFQALIGLAYWSNNMDEPRATALVDEALAGLRPVLVASEVEVEAGLMASYDMVRGYPAAPLRLLASSPDFQWGQAKLNGDFRSIPTVTSAGAKQPNVLLNSDMSVTRNGLPLHWQPLGSASQVSASGGTVKVMTDAKAWQGFLQTVKPGTFTAGEPLRLGVRSRLTLPAGKPGTSSKVMAYEQCSGKYRVLHTTTKLRSTAWTSYDLSFPAPRAGCSLEIRLTTGDKGPVGTTAEFDDVFLSRADAVGEESVVPSYDMLVNRTPVNVLTLTGEGSAVLQAHADGRWQDIADVSLAPGTPSETVIPERFTGRNLHYGYHEAHVAELIMLHRLTGEPLFLEFARRWSPLASAHNGLVPMEGRDASAAPEELELPIMELLAESGAGSEEEH